MLFDRPPPEEDLEMPVVPVPCRGRVSQQHKETSIGLSSFTEDDLNKVAAMDKEDQEFLRHHAPTRRMERIVQARIAEAKRLKYGRIGQ